MRVPDRQKQRQEYLKKKAGACRKIFSGSVGFLCLFSIAFVFFVSACAALIRSWIGQSLLWFVYAIVLGLWAWGMGYRCWDMYHFIKNVKEEQAAMAYSPPVTPNTLPAEEVLVRGSQEPTQEQSTVLLRAAGVGEEVPSEELLRASSGEHNISGRL
jgi:hypothetical protein